MQNVPQELIDYLHTMITPTHVGGESLIALDLDAVTWEEIPDERYHGFIGRGSPSPEQTSQIYRILKPGAHVMLMSPEDCPTGHKGACALEDRGFEIRDAILVVDRPGMLHYVSKASRKERHAGCEVLAALRSEKQNYVLSESEEGALSEELAEELRAQGVTEEQLEGISEIGIPGDLIPKKYKKLFQKVEGGSYGNNHPTVKPKDVMVRLMEDLPKGSTVLDPFMGSGTTMVACLEAGVNGIGIEQSSDYIQIADARVRYWDHANAAWVANEIVSDAAPVTPPAPVGDVFDMFADE